VVGVGINVINDVRAVEEQTGRGVLSLRELGCAVAQEDLDAIFESMTLRIVRAMDADRFAMYRTRYEGLMWGIGRRGREGADRGDELAVCGVDVQGRLVVRAVSGHQAERGVVRFEWWGEA
jgi:biotin-(acetyl-CoA carboxylase) ligase